MAISKANLLIQGLRGSIGKQIVIRQYRGKTVLSAYPNFENYKPSKKQLKCRKMMEQANAAARATVADPSERDAALLRLNVTRNRLHNALISEFFAKAREGRE